MTTEVVEVEYDDEILEIEVPIGTTDDEVRAIAMRARQRQTPVPPQTVGDFMHSEAKRLQAHVDPETQRKLNPTEIAARLRGALEQRDIDFDSPGVTLATPVPTAADLGRTLPDTLDARVASYGMPEDSVFRLDAADPASFDANKYQKLVFTRNAVAPESIGTDFASLMPGAQSVDPEYAAAEKQAQDAEAQQMSMSPAAYTPVLEDLTDEQKQQNYVNIIGQHVVSAHNQAQSEAQQAAAKYGEAVESLRTDWQAGIDLNQAERQQAMLDANVFGQAPKSGGEYIADREMYDRINAEFDHKLAMHQKDMSAAASELGTTQEQIGLGSSMYGASAYNDFVQQSLQSVPDDMLRDQFAYNGGLWFGRLGGATASVSGTLLDGTMMTVDWASRQAGGDGLVDDSKWQNPSQQMWSHLVENIDPLKSPMLRTFDHSLAPEKWDEAYGKKVADEMRHMYGGEIPERLASNPLRRSLEAYSAMRAVTEGRTKDFKTWTSTTNAMQNFGTFTDAQMHDLADLVAGTAWMGSLILPSPAELGRELDNRGFDENLVAGMARGYADTVGLAPGFLGATVAITGVDPYNKQTFFFEMGPVGGWKLGGPNSIMARLGQSLSGGLLSTLAAVTPVLNALAKVGHAGATGMRARIQATMKKAGADEYFDLLVADAERRAAGLNNPKVLDILRDRMAKMEKNPFYQMVNKRVVEQVARMKANNALSELSVAMAEEATAIARSKTLGGAAKGALVGASIAGPEAAIAGAFLGGLTNAGARLAVAKQIVRVPAAMRRAFSEVTAQNNWDAESSMRGLLDESQQASADVVAMNRGLLDAMELEGVAAAEGGMGVTAKQLRDASPEAAMMHAKVKTLVEADPEYAGMRQQVESLSETIAAIEDTAPELRTKELNDQLKTAQNERIALNEELPKLYNRKFGRIAGEIAFDYAQHVPEPGFIQLFERVREGYSYADAKHAARNAKIELALQKRRMDAEASVAQKAGTRADKYTEKLRKENAEKLADLEQRYENAKKAEAEARERLGIDDADSPEFADFDTEAVANVKTPRRAREKMLALQRDMDRKSAMMDTTANTLNGTGGRLPTALGFTKNQKYPGKQELLKLRKQMEELQAQRSTSDEASRLRLDKKIEKLNDKIQDKQTRYEAALEQLERARLAENAKFRGQMSLYESRMAELAEAQAATLREGGTIAARTKTSLQRAEEIRNQRLAQEKARYEAEVAVLDDANADINKRWTESVGVQARTSLGEVVETPGTVRTQDKVSTYNPEDGRFSSFQAGASVSDDALPMATVLNTLANLKGDEAAFAVKAINEFAAKYAETGVGFGEGSAASLGKFRSLNDLLQKLKESPGRSGGRAFAQRALQQVVAELVMGQATQSMLRSPNFRNKFVTHVTNRVLDNIAAQNGMSRAKLARSRGELVSRTRMWVESAAMDMGMVRTQGQSIPKGGKSGFHLLRNNPVFKIGDDTINFKDELFQVLQDPAAMKALKISPRKMKQYRQEALITLGSYLEGNMQRKIANDWSVSEMGLVSQAEVPGAPSRARQLETMRKVWNQGPRSQQYLASVVRFFAVRDRLPGKIQVPKDSGLSFMREWALSEEGSALIARVLKEEGVAPNSIPAAREAFIKSLEKTNQYTEFQDGLIPGGSVEVGMAPDPTLQYPKGLVEPKDVLQKRSYAGAEQLQRTNVTGDGGAKVFMDQGMTSSLGWMYGTSNALTAFGDNSFVKMMQGIGRAQNVNLTALRPATFITNVVSAALAKGARDGSLPHTVMGEVYQAYGLYRIANNPKRQVELLRNKSPRSAALADDIDSMKALEETGYLDKSFIDAEGGLMEDAMRFQNMDPYTAGVVKAVEAPQTLPGLRQISRKAVEAYRSSDATFKQTDALMIMRFGKRNARKMQIGGEVTLMDHVKGTPIGRIRRISESKFQVQRVVGDRKDFGKSQVVDIAKPNRQVVDGVSIPGKPDAMSRLMAESAMSWSNALYFDYSNVPGMLLLARRMNGVFFGPFLTWGLKALDIPFAKRGIGYHSALSTELPFRTKDPAFMMDIARYEMQAAVRRSMLLNSGKAQQSNVELDELRDMLPEYLSFGAVFDKEGLGYISLGTRNYMTGFGYAMAAINKALRPDIEDDFMRELRREEPNFAFLAKMLLGQPPMMSFINAMATGRDQFNRQIKTTGDLARMAVNTLAPGYMSGAADVVAAYVNPLNEFSTWHKYMSEVSEDNMPLRAYPIKVMLGRYFQKLNPTKFTRFLEHFRTAIIAEAKRDIKKLQANEDITEEMRDEAIKKRLEKIILFADFLAPQDPKTGKRTQGKPIKMLKAGFGRMTRKQQQEAQEEASKLAEEIDATLGDAGVTPFAAGDLVE